MNTNQPESSGYAVRPLHLAMLLCAALCANFIVVHGHNRQRIVEIVLVLLAGALFLTRRTLLQSSLFTSAQGKFLTGFFALGLLSSVMAFKPQYALFEVANFFLLYLLAMSLADEIAARGSMALRLVLQVVAAMIAFYALGFVLDYVGSLSLGLPLRPTDFSVGFSNIRFFNHVQTATLPLLILLCCLTPRTSKLGWLWFGLTIDWWMALFATSGRGTVLGMAAAFVLAAILLRRSAIPYLKQAAVTATLGVAAYFVLLVALPMLAGQQGMSAFSDTAARTAADPASNRLVLWQRAAELIAQSPLLGVGPMHFSHNAGDLHSGAHPHDWVLQIATEWGLPALACLIAALVLALRALLRARSRLTSDDVDNQAIATGLTFGAIAILVDGLVSGLFVMPQSQLAIALYLGCAIGWYRIVMPREEAAQASKASRLAGMVCVVAALAGVASVWPEMVARLESQPLTAEQKALNTGTHWPRLWETGYF
jgi:O-antigen ligase